MKEEALVLLKNGVMKGMCSPCSPGQWTQNVWSISDKGEVFEAQLENVAQGAYHGYPVPEDDDFLRVIRREWTQR